MGTFTSAAFYTSMVLISASAKVTTYSQYQMSKAQTRAANYNRLLRMQQVAAERRQWGYEQTSLRQQIALQQQEAAVNHSMAVAEAQSRFNNAEMLRNQAEAEAALERDKLRQVRVRLERLTSMQRARIAGSGVVESGSPLDVLAESGGEIEQVLNEQHYQANIDRMQGMRQAALEEFGGKLAFADANTRLQMERQAASLMKTSVEAEGLKQKAQYRAGLFTARVEQKAGLDAAKATGYEGWSQAFGKVADGYNEWSKWASVSTPGYSAGATTLEDGKKALRYAEF